MCAYIDGSQVSGAVAGVVRGKHEGFVVRPAGMRHSAVRHVRRRGVPLASLGCVVRFETRAQGYDEGGGLCGVSNGACPHFVKSNNYGVFNIKNTSTDFARFAEKLRKLDNTLSEAFYPPGRAVMENSE